MPPKGSKAKAKGKGKAKAKGKGKAKGKAKAKAVAEVVEAEVPVGEEALALAAEPAPKAKAKGKAKSKASAIRQLVLDALGDESADQVLQKMKVDLQTAEAACAEAFALVDAQGAQAAAALKEFDEVKEVVASHIEGEAAAMQRYTEIINRRREAKAELEEKKRELIDAQKLLGMLEVTVLNSKKQKQLEDQRRAAQDAVEKAKQRHKEALEATKRALEARKLSQGRGGRGRGRGQHATKEPAAAGEGEEEAEAEGQKPRSPAGSSLKRARAALPDELETVPATFVEGEDIE